MPAKEKKPAKKGNKVVTTAKHPRKGPASALRSSGVGAMRTK